MSIFKKIKDSIINPDKTVADLVTNTSFKGHEVTTNVPRNIDRLKGRLERIELALKQMNLTEEKRKSLVLTKESLKAQLESIVWGK